MANEGDVSLLFKLRMDAQQTKTATAEARAAVQQLRTVFGSELSQMGAISQNAFQAISGHVNDFARQRVPVAGNAIANLNERLTRLGSGQASKELEKVGRSIGDIARQSGRSSTEVASFLTRFVQLEGQAKRDKAAIDFFGTSLGTKLIPQLESTGSALVKTSSAAAGMGGSVAAVAGPIGIAVVALIAMAAATVLVAKEIFDLTKRAAEFQGQMFDLAQQTGISVETLSALEVVAATTGGSLGSMTASLGIFQRKLEDAQDPLSKSAALFRKLGVDTEDTEQALRDTLKAVSEMEPGFKQTATALELFGRGGKQLLAVLKETGGDLDGTIAKLRELGILITTEEAKAADEFNDQLAIIGFQLRAVTAILAQEAMPLILGALKEFSLVLQQNRDVIRLAGLAVAGFVNFLVTKFREGMLLARLFIEGHRVGWRALLAVLNSIIDAYEKIRQKISAIIALPPIPRIEPAPPAGEATPSEPPEDTAQRDLKRKISEQDEITAAQRAGAEERKRIAASELAQREADFIRGQATRRDEVEAQIKANKEKVKADLDFLEFERKKLQTQAALALAQGDSQKQKDLNAKILEADSEAASKRSELKNFEIKARAQLFAEERQQELAHRQRLLDIRARFDRAEIDRIKNAVAEGRKGALEGEREIQNIENLALDRRANFLIKTLEAAGVDPAKRQEILDQLKALNAERVAQEQDQAQRIREIQRRSADTQLSIIVSAGETAVRIGEINAARRIASIQALADAEVLTQEQAARRILEIQEGSIAAQEALLRIRLTAAGTIQDPNERAKAQADINSQLRVLQAERAQIQDDGNREIDAARQRDIDSAQEYAEELRAAEELIRDIEREAAAEEIDLMRLHFGNRRAIIRAQRDLDIAEENDRHRRATEEISRERRQVEERIKNLTTHLEGLKTNTAAEIEVRDTLIKKLEELRQKLIQLQRQQDAENRRTETRKRRVTKEAEGEEERFDPTERIRVGLEDIKEFADELEQSIVPLGEILAGTFDQISQAIGQTVANWVLLGETGPAVMRKILAQALASIAAEATVNAIKELALGFATLFFNPAESAAHFTSAGLWASIAGVSAIAGRSVAGNLFKPAQKTDRSGIGNQGTSGDGKRDPIDLIRDQLKVQLHLFLHNEPGPGFGNAVVNSWIDNVRTNGPARTVVQQVSEGGG